MNLQHLASTFYFRALGFLTAVHALMFVSSFFMEGWDGIGMLALSIGPYIVALLMSLISLLVFQALLANVSAAISPTGIYYSIQLRALASCVAGALLPILYIAAAMDSIGALVFSCYLIIPAFCTWLAVFQKRKLIYAAIQEEKQANENPIQQ